MSDYFDRKPGNEIPVWKPGTEIKFEITADKISGRIPVVRLESWEDFTPFVSTDFFNDSSVEYIFRGQRRYSWGLTPSLARNSGNGIVTQDLKSRQFEAFKKAARGRLLDSNIVEEEDELWAIGQHYGLKTPLLDWTYSPYVALFFAFSKQDSSSETDNPYRAVYILNKTFIEDDDDVPDIRVLEPKKDDHGRLVNQAGLFTFSPDDATIENKLTEVITAEDFMVNGHPYSGLSPDEEPDALAKYICKVYIKNENQQACVKHLRRMNVHHGSLFPDLIGASEYCNLLIDEATIIRPEPISNASDFVVPVIKYPVDPITNEPVGQEAAAVRSLLIQSILGVGYYTVEQIEDLAEKLSNTLEEYKVTDWQHKDSVHARFKNITRTMLRNHNVPEEYRTPVVEQIVDVMIREDENKEEQ
ncbi:FRG domain-containing protein [Maridesulfovibrio salexigens]|uniref:FRG domain protein n=1 Tax=Maridesulfovibrio salexigens (strain ATCC 14822 / DSM 2638 / NCIMB 8403 / VKM B-1763) TaxID=526222 RepID=C6BZF0_MARSD|nr:FRG domain-containing protein [Maridesulfovibrio salexigens]ACS80787.1 FRG domain protein [Maridesulfovibrio salexigens DSM 2638]